MTTLVPEQIPIFEVRCWSTNQNGIVAMVLWYKRNKAPQDVILLEKKESFENGVLKTLIGCWFPASFLT